MHRSRTTDILGELRAYWERIRKGRAMPARADIDPVDIPRLLPFVMLVDVLADPLDFKFRLIGTAIQSIITRNYVGRRFSELPHMAKGNPIWAGYASAVTERRPVSDVVDYIGVDRHVQRIRHCLMPLSKDGTSVNMMFVGVEIERR